jgi:transcriptional regulator with XRE-family HTH domain
MEELNKKTTKKVIVEMKEAIGISSDYALAKNLGVTPTVIGRYSNGINSISIDKLEDYAAQLGLTIEITFKKTY